MLTLRDVRTGRASRLRAKFVMVTHGILAGQYTLAERGLDPGGAFTGTLSLAGREGGRDCAVSRGDLTGKARLFSIGRCKQQALPLLSYFCRSCASRVTMCVLATAQALQHAKPFKQSVRVAAGHGHCRMTCTVLTPFCMGGGLTCRAPARLGPGCRDPGVRRLACEAMEAAVASNAASVTLVARERRRYGRGGSHPPRLGRLLHVQPVPCSRMPRREPCRPCLHSLDRVALTTRP